LEKLIIDKLISSVGAVDYRSVFYSVGLLVFLAIALSLIRNLLGTFNRYLRRILTTIFDQELTIIIGHKLAELDMGTIENPDFRDKFNKIETESGRRAWGLMMPISDIPNYLVGFISAVLVLIFVHPLISLAIVAVSLPGIFINSRFIKKGYELSAELSPLRRVRGWLYYYLVRNRNFMELKLLRLSDSLAQKLRKVSNEIIEKRMEYRKRRELSGFVGFIPLSIFELGLSLALIYWVVIQKITVGSFQLYLRSLRSAEQNLSGLAASLLEIYENYMYVTDLVWFLNLDPIVGKKTVKGKKISDRISISFKDVKFRYQETQPWAINGVNLSIKSGDKIALVGENGAGKSTLIKLLARFYDPQKGQVLINKTNLEDIDNSEWHKQLAILFQQFEIYPFSVKESIGYGDVRNVRSLKRVKEAAGKTGVDKYIESLPRKYDNPIAPELEGGVKPSAGQMQKIGISRMLFREDAKVLILDEPTSSVDPEAEEKIFKELTEITKEKILMFVTQRFSTVRVADRILVMHNGKIIEQGTHKDLMKLDGKYAKMFNIQAKAYLENSS
ncbi:MAG: ABC transporter ATP-binding protein, partial [Candidatus Hodarchaeales archaeon]|jgi:ATP-binding cassette subfamily B protein/ATP-binding cassette subfamily C protein